MTLTSSPSILNHVSEVAAFGSLAQAAWIMAGALVMGAAALLAAQPRKVLKPVPVRARRSRDRLR